MSVFDKLPHSGFGPTFVHEAQLPEGTGTRFKNGYVLLSTDLWVVMLMETSKGKFKNEPYLAVFDQHGFNDKALEICAGYSKALVHKNIDKLFAPLLERYKIDTHYGDAIREAAYAWLKAFGS